MAFPRSLNSAFSGRVCPQTPLVWGTLDARYILPCANTSKSHAALRVIKRKNSPILSCSFRLVISEKLQASSMLSLFKYLFISNELINFRENSLGFLDIKLSINDNGLSTSVQYKPIDCQKYLLHLSSHPQHVKHAISSSQFLRLRHLCSDDSDFNNKCEEMCQFFKKRG